MTRVACVASMLIPNPNTRPMRLPTMWVSGRSLGMKPSTRRTQQAVSGPSRPPRRAISLSFRRRLETPLITPLPVAPTKMVFSWTATPPGPQASRSNFSLVMSPSSVSMPLTPVSSTPVWNALMAFSAMRVTAVCSTRPSSATPRSPTSRFPWIRASARGAVAQALFPLRVGKRSDGGRREQKVVGDVQPAMRAVDRHAEPPRAGARQHEGGGPLQAHLVAGAQQEGCRRLWGVGGIGVDEHGEVGDFDLVGADHPNRAADAAIDEDAGGTVAPQPDGAPVLQDHRLAAQDECPRAQADGAAGIWQAGDRRLDREGPGVVPFGGHAERAGAVVAEVRRPEGAAVRDRGGEGDHRQARVVVMDPERRGTVKDLDLGPGGAGGKAPVVQRLRPVPRQAPGRTGR